jgi:hypothetical protein
MNVLSVNFKINQETYSGVIEISRKILSKIGDVKIEVNSTVFSLEVQLSDNLYKIDRFHRAIERETKSNLQMTRKSTQLHVDEKRFTLSKGHFCYRMELNSSEFVMFGKSAIKILNTGVRVEGDYFDATEEGNEIACIEDIIELKENSQETYRKSVITKNRDITVILVFGVAIALIILIMTGRVIFSCRNNAT